MNTQTEAIISKVRQAGDWGVLRKEWKQETFDSMAALVGMAGGRTAHFRNILFADGTRCLDARGISAISMYFGIDRSLLENLNKELNPSEASEANG